MIMQNVKQELFSYVIFKQKCQDTFVEYINIFLVFFSLLHLSLGHNKHTKLISINIYIYKRAEHRNILIWALNIPFLLTSNILHRFNTWILFIGSEQDQVSLVSDQWRDAITCEANHDGDIGNINLHRKLLYFVTLLWAERFISISLTFFLISSRWETHAVRNDHPLDGRDDCTIKYNIAAEILRGTCRSSAHFPFERTSFSLNGLPFLSSLLLAFCRSVFAFMSSRVLSVTLTVRFCQLRSLRSLPAFSRSSFYSSSSHSVTHTSWRTLLFVSDSFLSSDRCDSYLSDFIHLFFWHVRL